MRKRGPGNPNPPVNQLGSGLDQPSNQAGVGANRPFFDSSAPNVADTTNGPSHRTIEPCSSHMKFTAQSCNCKDRAVNILPRAKKLQAISMLVEGCSLRSASRMSGIHRDTIGRLLTRTDLPPDVVPIPKLV